MGDILINIPPDLSSRTDWISILGAITSLIAVIVGPLVSIYVVRKQIKATTISTNRQNWINQVRDSVAEFEAITNMIFLHLIQGADFEKELREQFLPKLSVLEEKLRLMINPKEEKHASLLNLLESVRTHLQHLQSPKGKKDKELQDCESHNSEILYSYRADRGKLTEVTQLILKEEWERVKKGS